jgi:putative acetyltransferase
MRLRPIRPEDDPAVADVIRTVMPEFGASGPGFAIHDAEVGAMSTAYGVEGAVYWVVVDADDRVLGGGGVARLAGGDEGTCELRKMYFLPQARGQGMGKTLLAHLMTEAKRLGYRTCYLETLTGMDAAQHLYEQLGFARLCGPAGQTGHFSCDRFYSKAL